MAPEIETIKEIVGKAYQVNNLELLVSKRGILNEPRSAAIYLRRQLRRSGFDEICKAFQMRWYSSASSAIERMKNELSKNKEMSLGVEKIKLEIFKEKSQTKA
ncbi:MAG: hypothetical protein GXO96_07395 [Nitrospirae bacterium]|nr:hypothetical protein [Candidatus Manganitrophaceae bacterium]